MIELKKTLEIKPERYPLYCQWELTCLCNLRCVMCYTDCNNRPEKIRRELPTAQIFRIMDELKDAGCVDIRMTGGEPLSRPDFFAIYERARRSGFLVSVFTNGTLIDEKAADRFAAEPPNRIEISLHGVTAKTFEAVTAGPGSFDRCMKAIRLLRERKIPLLLKATAMTLNQDELLAVKAYSRDLGIPFRLGEAMRPTLEGSDAPGRYDLPPDGWSRLCEADEDIGRELRAKTGARPPCRTGEETFHIDAYGLLQLCSGNRRQGYDLTKGSFKEGFYRHLPNFPCPNKAEKPIVLAVLRG